MGFHIETKTIGALNRVSHKTLESESGGLAEDFKLEYKPDFKPFGRTTLWTLAGNHTSLLNGPKSLSAVSIAAKTSITDKSTITAKLPLDKKKPSLALKFETGEYKSIRNWVNEVKVAQGGPVCVESEVYLPGDNKFQVETKGSKADSMKLTHTEGKNQIKLKYILSTKAPVLGFDTFVGSQKWDLEYNVKSELMVAKVKVAPMTLQMSTNMGRKESGVGPVSYKLTAERSFRW